jgi:hypothetical protein
MTASLPPSQGAYFRLTKDIDGLRAGDLVLAWSEQAGKIQAQRGEKIFSYATDEFVAHFQPAPGGRTERLAELDRLLAQSSQTESTSSAGLLENGDEAREASSSLVTTRKRNEVVEARRAALQAKHQVEMLKTELRGILSEQEKVLALAAQKWSGELERLTYTIESINLYLGRDEHFVSIQDGEPALPEQPISIRQTVLYMDEECALNTDKGGIDFQNIADFDRWLCQPSHLQQVLPEIKGVVALRIRRGEKFYADASIWEKIMFNQANGGTYILIRNGQRLWRVWNDLELPGHLFPTTAEFTALFHDRWSREPLQPGTLRYQHALQEAQGLRKLYLQAALLLQGIIDRTRVFHPSVSGRINLLDPCPDPARLRLIRDAENLLGNGRAPYHEWLRACNHRLEVGKRVVFGGTSYQRHRHEDSEHGYSRTVPKFVDWPAREQVYTLSGRASNEDGDFQFQFSRTDGQRRATFHVRVGDEFILNFDDALRADIEFYLADRANRHHYLSSFPLLRAALRLKQEEQSREKPFLDLLARESSRELGMDIQQVYQLLAVVIPWWKQKNKFSRGLIESENAAYRQILQEIRLRFAIQANTATQEAVARIQESRPDWLVIGKDTGHTLVCLRSLPGITGLVVRETWSLDGREMKVNNDCYMPGSETGRWQIMAAQPPWAEWPKHGRREQFLAEPEYQRLLAEALDLVMNCKHAGQWKTLVAVTASNEALYLHGVRVQDNYWGGGSARSEWVLKRAYWKRVKGTVQLASWFHWSTLSSVLCLQPNDPNPNVVDADRYAADYEKSRLAGLPPDLRKLPFTAYGHRLLWFDEAALGESRRILLKIATRRRREQHRWAIVRFHENHIEQTLKERFWQHERQKYLADGGVEELWEDHAKTVRFQNLELDRTDLQSCLSFLIENSVPLSGRYSGEIWGLAHERGWKQSLPHANTAIPADIRFSEPPGDLE